MTYQVVVSDIQKYLESSPSIKSWINLNAQGIVSNLINLVLVVAFVAFLLLLLLGGIQWITSGGDKESLAKARGKLTSAIIGIIIVISTWAILGLVKDFFGINQKEKSTSSQYICPALNGKKCRPGTLSPGPCNYPPEGNCCICKPSGLWEKVTVNPSQCQVKPGDCQ